MKQRLELTWIGKGEEDVLEPRILIENPEYSYGDPDTGNLLIHGDNLLALRSLVASGYAGKVKCIYIDPPYNTGSAFTRYDDMQEHSIWLGLMRMRIQLLHELLREDGVIFISIDDHEVAYLQILMDEVFGRSNFIANLPTIMNLKGNQDQFGFAGTHEYTICYAKNKIKTQLNTFQLDEEKILEEWNSDAIGLYKKGATLKSTGEDSTRKDRPKMFYPILVNPKGEVHCIAKNEYDSLYADGEFNDTFLNGLVQKYENMQYVVILPYTANNEYGRWRWGFKSFELNYKTEIIVIKGRNNSVSLYKKQRPKVGDIPTRKPKSLFYRPEYSSGNGTTQIQALFGKNTFDYPKPEHLIGDLLHIGSSPGDLVLDSFLGSGTTAAVAHKMGRRYIGIELGDHAYTHCVPRLKKVIDGTDQGGITASTGWAGGGGFRFCELAPTLLNEDENGVMVISPEYNAEMLAAAMALHEGFRYAPDAEVFWKQGHSTESDYIYTTTQHLTIETLQYIDSLLGEGETLLICCTSHGAGLGSRFPRITVKRIPRMLLGRCAFDPAKSYDLNIITLPEVEPQDEEDDE